MINDPSATTLSPQSTESRPIRELVFFAPIAQMPLSHGGSIRSVRLFEEICRSFNADGTLVGSNFDCCIRNGKKSMVRRTTDLKSKTAAAVGSLLHSDHYLKEKQLCPSLCAHFRKVLSRHQPDAIFMSYLYSSVLLEELPKGTQVFIDTHNDDWEWFQNFKRSTSNPLIKQICDNSLTKTDEYVESLPEGTRLIHVSEGDAEAYRRHRPDLQHFVVPNGCSVKSRAYTPDYGERLKRLLFVGSLSSQMNVDALHHLRDHFWETLKEEARLTVVGSNPSREVINLCRNQGWHLIANASDDELSTAYESAHFAVLPFQYGAGSKLKLAEACGRSTPVLSTSAGAQGVNDLPPGLTVSDSPQDWLETLRSFHYNDEAHEELIRFAEKHSWSRIAEKFCNQLSTGEATPLVEREDDSAMPPQDILIHDFGGYPFIIEASRQLAKQGHRVQHHFVSITGSDRDELERFAEMEPNLTVVRHKLADDYPQVKYSFAKRLKRELDYGNYLEKVIVDAAPDVIISANAPSHIQSRIAKAGKQCEAVFIPWLQDFYSLAVSEHLNRSVPILGSLAGRIYTNWERAILRDSDHVAVISDDFNPQLQRWGLSRSRLHTIQNWATLSDIPVLPKSNDWAKARSLDKKFCFLYSGTMGLKHNPDTLVELAKSFEHEPDVKIVVVGEGAGVDYLKEQDLPNLHCLPFQSMKDFPQVLATADVLTALLEPSAGLYSVPSKVLSYLCAQRAILLSVPRDNLAARTVLDCGAGKVADPRELDAYIAAAHDLFKQRRTLDEYGRNARAYAEAHFSPDQIGNRFDELIRTAA